MRSLGVILARAKSRRLPNKNLKSLFGVPLVAYVGRAALASSLTRLILSTEDHAIADAAESYDIEAPFRRPERLAEDYASSEDILFHALDWVERDEGQNYDVIVTLQPTTPFIETASIDACLRDLETTDAACCFTARGVSEPPQWMFKRGADGVVGPLLGGAIQGEREHSQLLEKYFVPTGAAYATRTAALRSQRRVICDPAHIVEMDPRRSVDIDEPIDLLLAEVVGREFGFAITPPSKDRN